jgi:hypothetical protein
MLISRLVAGSLALGLLPGVVKSDCIPRDFLSLTLETSDTRPAIAQALEIAYPGASVDTVDGIVTIDGTDMPLGAPQERSVLARIADATIYGQFAIVYPLSFDPAPRREPWFDPGRIRNDPMFRALYGTRETQIAATLRRVTYTGSRTQARFSATTRQCVATQLQAAVDAIADEGAQMDRFFETVGGSFNWRVIAGTQRLSAHSFGIAVDFNTQLGGYWRWSGEQEGAVGDYNNHYPEKLVHHMERFGFIWGGKWHHFDGMHFEYRPELILFARLQEETQR